MTYPSGEFEAPHKRTHEKRDKKTFKRVFMNFDGDIEKNWKIECKGPFSPGRLLCY